MINKIGTKVSRPSYYCSAVTDGTLSDCNTDLGEGLQGWTAQAVRLLQPPIFCSFQFPSRSPSLPRHSPIQPSCKLSPNLALIFPIWHRYSASRHGSGRTHAHTV